MTGLSWMLLTAALMLFAVDSSCAVNQNLLATIIDEIWTDYKLNRMFSLAVSIPRTQNNYDISGVLNQENGAQVKNIIKSGGVYKEGRIVAATFIPKKKSKTDDDIHAEYRVLQDFDFLLNNNNNYQNDLLIFYVLGSPCYYKCTNPNHPDKILNYLKNIEKWTNYAFVFTYIYESKNKNLESSDEDRRTAIQNLADEGGLGLKNIFRCEEKDGSMECNSCSQNNQIAHYCISNEPENKAGQQGSSRSRNNSPSPSMNSRKNSPSQSINSRNNSPSQSVKSRNNSPSQSVKSRNNSPSQSIRGRDNSPSQQSPLLNRNRPDVSPGNNVGDSVIRRLCLSCLNCCRGRRPLSDKS